MSNLSPDFQPDHAADGAVTLHFTPVEWRQILKDGAFLQESDNRVLPRRLMGLDVRIVPDHSFG